MKTLFYSFVFILILFLLAFLGLNWKHFKNFPQVLPTFQAKEVCSCLYVSEQGENYCRELVRQWLPSATLIIESEARRVKARAFGVERSARFESFKYGCQLE